MFKNMLLLFLCVGLAFGAPAIGDGAGVAQPSGIGGGASIVEPTEAIGVGQGAGVVTEVQNGGIGQGASEAKPAGIGAGAVAVEQPAGGIGDGAAIKTNLGIGQGAAETQPAGGIGDGANAIKSDGSIGQGAAEVQPAGGIGEGAVAHAEGIGEGAVARDTVISSSSSSEEEKKITRRKRFLFAPYSVDCNKYYGRRICYRLYEHGNDEKVPNGFTCWKTKSQQRLAKLNCTETTNLDYLYGRDFALDLSQLEYNPSGRKSIPPRRDDDFGGRQSHRHLGRISDDDFPSRHSSQDRNWNRRQDDDFPSRSSHRQEQRRRDDDFGGRN